MITFNNNFEKWIRNECVCLRGFRIGKNSFLQTCICTLFVFLNVFLQFLWQTFFLYSFRRHLHFFRHSTRIHSTTLHWFVFRASLHNAITLMMSSLLRVCCDYHWNYRRICLPKKWFLLCERSLPESGEFLWKRRKKNSEKIYKNLPTSKKLIREKSALQTQCRFRYRRRKMN